MFTDQHRSIIVYPKQNNTKAKWLTIRLVEIKNKIYFIVLPESKLSLRVLVQYCCSDWISLTFTQSLVLP